MNNYEIVQIPLLKDTRHGISAADIVSSHIIKRDGISILILVVKKQ